MNPCAGPRSPARVRWILSVLVILAGLAVMFLGLMPDRMPYFALIMLGRATLVALGVGVALVGLGLGWLPPRFGLLVTAAVYASLGGAVIMGLRAAARGEFLWAFTFQNHPRYGAVGTPNQEAFHFSYLDFKAYYTIGPDGFRATPAPAAAHPRGTVLFLGCSYTFGIGVNDDKCYPNILAREFWPHYRVENRTFPGWGTAEALLVLEDALAESPPPSVVLYGLIDDHLHRNSLRKSWHSSKIAWGGKVQKFTLEEGRLVYHGMVAPEEAQLPDAPETDRIEHELTIALLDQMRRLCAARNIPLFIVVLNQKFPNDNPVVDALLREGTDVINARFESDRFFKVDNHPTVDWHRGVAEKIAADERLRFLKEK